MISLSILSVFAAQDFVAETRRLQETSNLIDSKMRSMGFFIGSKEASPASDEKPVQRKIITVYSDGSALRAHTGRLLNAQTTNRLVVGPEGSPTIITIDNDQGLFSGLKVLGLAKQASTEGRLYIDFERLVFRSGKVQPIKGTALDESGAYGLKAQVLSSKALMVAGSIAGSFISGYAASQQTVSQNAFGFSQTQPGNRNGVLQGVAQTAADQSKRLIEDATKEKPILVVEPETKVSLYLDEEVRF
mgnify:CR=1 FL=1